MNIAVILAGGSGTRMGSSSKPKQFLKIKNKEIVLMTIESFLKFKNINKILVVIKKEWKNELSKIIKKITMSKDLEIINGGSCRNDSIKKAITWLSKKYSNNDIILIHDSVRPFVTEEIINNNIKSCMETKEVSYTCIPFFNDLVIEEKKSKYRLLPRQNLYISQSPETANLGILKKIYSIKYNDKLYKNSGMCHLAEANNMKINIVNGSEKNFKITTKIDLDFANFFVKNTK